MTRPVPPSILWTVSLLIDNRNTLARRKIHLDNVPFCDLEFETEPF
jgi:hypothetical protein